MWRIPRSWRLSVPADCRCQVPQVLRWAVSCEGARAALPRDAAGLSLHCRPGEACALERGYATLFAQEVLPRFPGAYGIVRVRKPKAQRAKV